MAKASCQSTAASFYPMRNLCLPAIALSMGIAIISSTATWYYFKASPSFSEGAFGYPTQVWQRECIGSAYFNKARLSAMSAKNIPAFANLAVADNAGSNFTWHRIVITYQAQAGSAVPLDTVLMVEAQLRALPSWRGLCGQAPRSCRALCELGSSLAAVLLPEPRQSASDVGEQPGGVLLEDATDASNMTLAALRSSFSFYLPVEAAAKGGPWEKLIHDEVRPALDSEQDGPLNVLYTVDAAGSLLEAQDFRRSAEEALPLVLLGAVGTTAATLLVTQRLLLSLTAGFLAVTSPLIGSIALAERTGSMAEAQLPVVAFAAWTLVAVACADLAAACARASEVWRLQQRVPSMPKSRQNLAPLLLLLRFVVEALVPQFAVGMALLALSFASVQVPLLSHFAQHASCGLMLASTLAGLLCPSAVCLGDVLASEWRSPPGGCNACLPLECGARPGWRLVLGEKARSFTRDALSRWWLRLLALAAMAAILATAATFGRWPRVSAATPPLFVPGHRIRNAREAEVLFGLLPQRADAPPGQRQELHQCAVDAYEAAAVFVTRHNAPVSAGVLCSCGLDCGRDTEATQVHRTSMCPTRMACTFSLSAPAMIGQRLVGTEAPTSTVDIVVVFGLVMPTGPPSLIYNSPLNFDRDFKVEHLDAQRSILALCEGVYAIFPVVSQHCWLADFKRWLLLRGQRYPVPPEDFYRRLAEFMHDAIPLMSSEDGSPRLWLDGTNRILGFYVVFAVEAPGPVEGMALLGRWTTYVQLWNSMAALQAGQAWLVLPSLAAQEELQAVTQTAKLTVILMTVFIGATAVLVTCSCGLALALMASLTLALTLLGAVAIGLGRRTIGVLEMVLFAAFVSCLAAPLVRVVQQYAYAQEAVCPNYTEDPSELSGVGSYTRTARKASPSNHSAVCTDGDPSWAAAAAAERRARSAGAVCRGSDAVLCGGLAAAIAGPLLFPLQMEPLWQVGLSILCAYAAAVPAALGLLPMLMQLGLGPSRIKRRALLTFAGHLACGCLPANASCEVHEAATGVSKPSEDWSATAGMLSFPCTLTCKLRRLFCCLGSLKHEKRNFGGDVGMEEGPHILALDVHGATAKPPIHLVMTTRIKFDGAG